MTIEFITYTDFDYTWDHKDSSAVKLKKLRAFKSSIDKMSEKIKAEYDAEQIKAGGKQINLLDAIDESENKNGDKSNN